MATTSQYSQTDIRNNYSSSGMFSRITNAVQSLPQELANINRATYTFAVDTIDELNALSLNYGKQLFRGDTAILFDANNIPAKLYTWSADKGWQEMPGLSVSGPVLTPATVSDIGIVQFANMNETASLKAVQANDPRLNKQWVAQTVEPTDKTLLWIDTSSDPIIKFNSNNNWLNINSKLIDDASESTNTTLSSKTVKFLLSQKAASDHIHTSYSSHVNAIGNVHGLKASDLTDLQTEISKNTGLASVITAKHQHNNSTVLAKFSEVLGEVMYNSQPIGKGDMQKSVYDKNNTGIIDKAASITDGINIFDSSILTILSDRSHAHSNFDILNSTTAVFTDELKDKLETIESNATSYVHPDTHPATMIVQDDGHKFVSISDIAKFNDKYTKTETDKMLSIKIGTDIIGKPNGVAGLNPDGTIPVEQIPMKFKDTKVTETIAERDLLNKYSGLRVFVADASSDPAVGSGSAEYAWNGVKWILLSDFGLSNGSMQFLIDEVNNKLVVKIKYTNGITKTGMISLI